MWVSSIHLRNIKSFADSGTIALSKGINVLLGANNVGKSILIKALLMLQVSQAIILTDLRIGQIEGEIVIDLEDISDGYAFTNIKKDNIGQDATSGKVDLKINYANDDINNPQIQGTVEMGGTQRLSFSGGGGFIGKVEPNNFIYPFLSKRKAIGYSDQINKTNANTVSENLNNIVSKIDRIANPQHPAYEAYKNACESIIGFFVSTFQTSNGKQAGIVVSNFDSIPLEAMGEGVVNLVGIIADLCLAENKLFLIEELENDIHPQALKRLLELIIQKSQTNQFVITTHSNIVTRYLGSAPGSKIHQITMSPYSPENRLPTASYKETGNTPQERWGVLEDLGYELVDLDVWAGWLFLEEATAESIIIKYLIPTFVPTLEPKLRTVSTGGNSKVEDKFEDFNRLFLFTYLTPIYKNKTWVLLDGDSESQEVIKRLKDRYRTWCQDNFKNFAKKNFEEYYPASFQPRIQEVLALPHGLDKQTAKAQLVDEVMNWVAENKDAAKEEFAKSASEVIKILKEIDATI